MKKKKGAPKVRHGWAINPKTRVKKSSKLYSRPKAKQNSRRSFRNGWN